MLNALGISEWVAISLTAWLAVQLPLGMFVGFYLRRAAVLSADDMFGARPFSADLGSSWQELLQARPVAHPALTLTAR